MWTFLAHEPEQLASVAATRRASSSVPACGAASSQLLCAFPLQVLADADAAVRVPEGQACVGYVTVLGGGGVLFFT